MLCNVYAALQPRSSYRTPLTLNLQRACWNDHAGMKESPEKYLLPPLSECVSWSWCASDLEMPRRSLIVGTLSLCRKNPTRLAMKLAFDLSMTRTEHNMRSGHTIILWHAIITLKCTCKGLLTLCTNPRTWCPWYWAQYCIVFSLGASATLRLLKDRLGRRGRSREKWWRLDLSTTHASVLTGRLNLRWVHPCDASRLEQLYRIWQACHHIL